MMQCPVTEGEQKWVSKKDEAKKFSEKKTKAIKIRLIFCCSFFFVYVDENKTLQDERTVFKSKIELTFVESATKKLFGEKISKKMTK